MENLGTIIIENDDLEIFMTVANPFLKGDIGPIGETGETGEQGPKGDTPTKTDLGLENVDNTSDINKPISQAAEERFNSIERVVDSNYFELIAHRGFVNANVENTIVALQSALTQGADSIECDVKASINGTPYLFHDATVNTKTNGTGTFTDLTDATINSLRLTIADNTIFEGIKIPKLVDVVNAIKHRKFKCFYPEIKGYNNQLTDITTMINIVKNVGLSKRTMWQSFNFADLPIVNQLDEDCEVGFLVWAGTQAEIEGHIDNIADNLTKGSLLAKYELLLDNPSVVQYAKNKNVGIGTWTPNTKQLIMQLLDIGVKRIMTDVNIQEVR